MNRISLLAVAMCSLTFAACGGGDDGGKDGVTLPDAKTNPGADAPPAPDAPGSLPDSAPAGPNALGQLCPAATGGGGMMCPAGNTCVRVNGLGSMTTGYCTPDCAGNNATCSTGYTGPAGSTQVCALTTMGSTMTNGCAIVCTDVAQCPTGMGCVVAQGTTKICVPN